MSIDIENLTEDQARVHVSTLQAQLKQWAQEYYENDAPSVEDAVYDEAYNQILALEARFPALVTADSITPVSYTHLTLPTN